MSDQSPHDTAVAMVADGASLNGAGRAVGLSAATVRYHCRRAGVKTRHDPPERLVTINRRTQRLSEWSRETGIRESTLLMRIQRGDTDEEIVRPTRPCHRPDVYEVGLSIDQWHEVIAYAASKGSAREAAWRLGLPQGAVSAALRGEWERLG